MTVYVDALFEWTGPRGHSWWCHMMSDASDEELHAFAQRIGLKRSWFQRDHYDLVPSKRELAVRMGATECDSMKLVEIRRSKRT